MKTRTVRIIVVNLILSLAGIALLVGGAEMYLRKKHSDYDLFDAGYEKPWFRGNRADLTKVFAVDSDIGFCPIIPGPQYNEFGTLRNTYSPEKSNNVERLLFVGDSVTRIGFIVAALREASGDRPREFWNAGVDSFNTVQELNYYKKFNCKIRPDHVILTFHNNDFETTPIVFLNEQGKMVLFSPFLPRNQVNEVLFRKSYLYRMFIGKSIARRRDAGREQIVAEVKTSLQEFRTILSRDGIQFTVLVHPVLLPKDKWTPSEILNHNTVLQILKDLGITHCDLSEPLRDAIQHGINPQWEMWKNDKAHPSPEMAKHFADYLLEHGLLNNLAGRDGRPASFSDAGFRR